MDVGPTRQLEDIDVVQASLARVNTRNGGDTTLPRVIAALELASGIIDDCFDLSCSLFACHKPAANA